MSSGLQKILLIDRDGTINRKSCGTRYIEKLSDLKIIPEAKQALKLLSEKGFKFLVITNQAGINKGIINKKDIKKIHDFIKKDFQQNGIDILDFYVCPHEDYENCKCRKPMPGMFYKCQEDYNINLEKVMYVGDDIKDCYAAKNAGSNFIFVGNPEELKYTEFSSSKCYENLFEAVDDILEFYNKG